jgi:NAD-dependent SIR2 family protein deacetylase
MNTLHTDIPALRNFVAEHPRLAVLTGAGVSASSGIPTYRDQQGTWRHSAPITHQEFIVDGDQRRRYWARSMLGWPVVREARPNAAHRALAQLERSGRVELLITQNVDRLHQRAGSHAVIDLHGRVDQVRCLACQALVCREQLQQRMLRDNPLHNEQPRSVRPDGDADIDDELVRQFRPPACDACGGTLIPDVVFFGGAVPAQRVQHCLAAVAAADALLVVGSSLQVYSGFRFCRLASQLDKPVAIINPGITRADSMAALKCYTECESLLAALTARL